MESVIRREKLRLVAALVILLLAFALRLHRTPILGAQSDEGVHLVVADHIRDGGVLYRDIFENRTPLVEWLLAGMFSISGTSQLLGRLLTVSVSTLTVAGLIATARMLRELLFRRRESYCLAPWSDLLGPALFAISPLAVFWSRFIMLEPWQTATSVLAVLFAIKAAVDDEWRWYLGAGLWSGLAVMSKQAGLVVTMSILAYLILLGFKGKLADLKRSGVFFIAGFLIPLLIFFLLLVAQGSLNPFLSYISGVERLAPFEALNTKIPMLLQWGIRQPAFVMALAAGFIMVWQKLYVAWIIPIWAAAEALTIMSPPRLQLGWGGYSHYALPMIAALSLLGGAVFLLIARLQRRLFKGVVISLIALISGGAALISMNELDYVSRHSMYPQPTSKEEKNIAETIRAVTESDDQVLIYANSILYHYSQRSLPDVLFQLPEYLPGSDIWDAFEQETVTYLDKQVPAAVLISRLHLDERVTPPIHQVLWDQWNPVDLFPYPYQNDVILFLPQDASLPGDTRAVANFREGIRLLDINVEQLSDKDIIVKLAWSAEQNVEMNPVVFLHMLSPEGQLVAQKDGVPAAGFRPVSTWSPQETIQDWRRIRIPDDFTSDEYEIRVGLYDPGSGQRYHLVDPEDGEDYISIKGHLH